MLARLSPLIAVAAAVIVGSGQVSAQAPVPSAGARPFDGNGGFQSPTAGPSDSCLAGFIPLREEAERRSRLVKAAGDRHAPPDEACKLITSFGQAELKMIKYIDANAASCGIPMQVTDQLKNRHSGTEGLQNKACALARQMLHGEPGGPTGDFDGSDHPVGSPNGPS